MEPFTTLDKASQKIGDPRLSATSPEIATKLAGSGSAKSFKARRSPAPKPLSEIELQSQLWTWVDWVWWTAFNLSMSKS